MFIEKFLQYIKYEKGYSSHTFVSYQTDLIQFRDFVESRNIAFEPDRIDSSLVREWIVSLMEGAVSASSVNRKLSSLKSFYRFLKQHDLVSHNPLKKITAPKNKKMLPVFLKEDEMENLLDGYDHLFENDFEGTRDKLMIEMFYTLGIRLSELINIKDNDIDLGRETVMITGKRNKQRLLPFGDRFKNAVSEYLMMRNEVVPDRSGNLFVREDGEKLYPMLVYRVVNKYITMVSSLSKRSPHVLRHTFATAMLNRGAELNAVKELLGHSSLAATEVYTHTTFEQLQKIYKQAHPRA
ncbi:MAG: tyrosine recombinase XerC [Prevotellaceae bacterium]|nr:tyrosine recombinase XerC [Prevotellaceae bacterium]